MVVSRVVHVVNVLNMDVEQLFYKSRRFVPILSYRGKDKTPSGYPPSNIPYQIGPVKHWHKTQTDGNSPFMLTNNSALIQLNYE